MRHDGEEGGRDDAHPGIAKRIAERGDLHERHAGCDPDLGEGPPRGGLERLLHGDEAPREPPAARERRELSGSAEDERRELTGIYVNRGLDAELAAKVADQLMARDALGAHARDELGISEAGKARPVQAAVASAASFSIGAALPLLMVVVAPSRSLVPAVSVACLVFLGLLGAVGARAGGAPIGKAILRVIVWGALAMATTSAVGALVGRAG